MGTTMTKAASFIDTTTNLVDGCILGREGGILTAILNEENKHNNNDDGHKDDDDTENNNNDDDDVVGCLSCRGGRVKQRLFVTTG
jgi:hypothetical protein